MYRTIIVVLTLLYVPISYADIQVGIMPSQHGDAERIGILAEYISANGIKTSLLTPPSYSIAERMFTSGEITAMFSGSAVAGYLILNNIAEPAVRPITNAGYSTYWAVVITKKGSPPFSGTSDYFTGKRVAFTALASAGEVYYRSLPGATEARNVYRLQLTGHTFAVQAALRDV